ncbi:MAG: sigma 54-interacting transcriptional regulator [Clostridium cadaveris]|uniref:AAA family ATPase n=1 Tax=Clostridium cadaveris TaxID=1529 RepID=A0A316M2X5_9CLOT|nr:sigma 54-interacting transcriptional regulator [Clostridium cadaveris]MDU4951628.1 sigma 54-interacting transcriptional regulator [Clostridium sp.]MDY4950066.1 sigma 54-interacting transcriptional regulator [Clostridium cadaveris]NME63535.1 sigma 54-interacting transcriptional regulator [Clostridium cadaveris]PWL51445.1 MAG: AAA family ATPase [Clostridium cadaveris]
MKTIAIVTDGKNKLDEFLKENLLMVLKEYIKVTLYHFNALEDDFIINEDIVLVMLKNRVNKIKKYVDENKKVIVIERTLKAKDIYKLFSIPNNVEVLVVNDNYETTLEMTSLLYELGIDHLKLVPYDFKGEYKNIKIAITPGESKFIPKHIENVIDLGNRIIDVSTFYKILVYLEIEREDVINRLTIYSNELINVQSGINESLKKMVIKNNQLKTVLNICKNGILQCSADGNVVMYNDKFLEIMNFKDDIENKNIIDILPKEMQGILKAKEVKDEIIRINLKYLNVNKKIMYYMGEVIGIYFYIEEITYIRQLEQNLSKKLREKGQIARYNLDDIVTVSNTMVKCKNLADKVSKTDLTVLITGESGTGKELIAQSIHNNSKRYNQPFVAINCAAMPENLLESELFGYDSGAFTGANKEGKRGVFEQANHGTIFLDEIGDMPMHLQTKLLRVLQERQVVRIGSENVIEIDVRIIAATNKNIAKLIDEDKFRRDLYYRLNILPIKVPNLKERKEDIVLLLKRFIGKEISISDEVVSLLENYNWPGNVRELKNVASYIETLCCSQCVSIEDLPQYLIEVNYKIFDEHMLMFKQNKIFDLAIIILKELNQNKGNGIGRVTLMESLKRKNVILAEGKIKRVLNILNSVGMVKSHVGRGGSSITDKGIEFLTYVK